MLEPKSRKIADELLKAAKEKAQSANKVLIVWIVALMVLWFNQILPQFFKINSFSDYRQILQAGRPDRATRKKLETALRNLAPTPRLEDTAAALKPLTQDQLQTLGKDTLRQIVNEPIELPLGIKLNFRNTLIPALWCFVCIGVLSFLLVVRLRCYRLIACAIRSLDGTYRYSPNIDNLVLDLPWWLGPPPSRPGEKVPAAQFRTVMGWQTRHSLAITIRYIVFIVLACAFFFTLYVSWKSTTLVEQEMSFHIYPGSTRTPLGVSLYQIELFVIREGSIGMLFLAMLWAINWFRPRRVPDSIQESSDIDLLRRQLAIQISLFAFGMVLLPCRNLGKSLLTPAQRNPRFRKKKRTLHLSAAYKTEHMVEGNLRSNSIKPHEAYEQLWSALLKEPRDLRLYDRIAALTVQFNLADQRLRLIDMAQRVSRKQESLHRSPSPLTLDAGFTGSRLLTRSTKSLYRRRSFWERIITGSPDHPQGPEGKGAKKCFKGKWIRRIRRHSKPSFESLLQRRVERWTNPDSQWIKKWSENGPRAKRGWLLPSPAPPGKPQCFPRA